MPHNYLHIWPRGKFMMIALPNQVKINKKIWKNRNYIQFCILEIRRTKRGPLRYLCHSKISKN